MKKFMVSFCLIVAFSPATAQNADELQPVELTFKFSYNGIDAAIVRDKFSPLENGNYRIDSHAEALGLAKILYGDIRRTSEGRVVWGNLETHLYEQQRGSRAPRRAEYNTDSRVLKLQRGEEKREERVADHTPLLDYLTALYQPYISGEPTPGEFAFTEGWRLRTYEYTLGDLEKVATPAGEFEAIPLRRDSPRGPRVFWVSPALNLLPIKIYVDDKGHVFESLLSKAVVGGEVMAAEPEPEE